jgi:hypothetical protein
MRGAFKGTVVDYVGYNLWHNGAAVSDEDAAIKDRHTTAIYTDVAVAQLSAATSSDTAAPFFLYLAYQAVHAPMEVPSSYIDGTIANGCDAMASDEITGDSRKVTPRSRTPQCSSIQTDLTSCISTKAIASSMSPQSWSHWTRCCAGWFR